MMRIERPDIPAMERLRGCVDAIGGETPAEYCELAAALAERWSVRASRTRIVGLGGGQGSGKSTLAGLLVEACKWFGIRAVAISLDDFYRTKAEREEMAQRLHRLFETRGPPGTHDMARLRETLAALAEGRAVAIPAFDKGCDDRVGERVLDAPVDVIILEGWCVGAARLDAKTLAQPINELEREEDPDGSWRVAISRALEEDYLPLWEMIDEWIFLRVPDLDSVRRWRLQQEQDRLPSQRLDPAEIDRFVQHYERVTLAMLDQEPRDHQTTVVLDRNHRIDHILPNT